MKTYRGYRDVYKTQVSVDENGFTRSLPGRLDLANHSPTGFEWGYGGSGPAQLALAILANCLGDDESALGIYQQFKRDFVSGFGDAWTLTEPEIREWVEKQAAQALT